MKIYKLEGYFSYTSYIGLTREQEIGIEQSQRPLPTTIILPNGEKIDWHDAYRLSEKRTRSGYALTDHGIRIKYESSKSPDYDKPNGHGNCHQWLTIKSPFELSFE